MATIDGLKGEIDKINSKVSQAVRIRNKLLMSILEFCQTLEQNPVDEAARRGLITNISREEHFLDIIKKGSKETVSILKRSLSEIKKVKEKSEAKDLLIEIILNLIDAMRFTSKKIHLIEQRVWLGRKLETRRYVLFGGKIYSKRRLMWFINSLEEEKDLDAELSLRLEGKLEKLLPNFHRLKRELKMAIPVGLIGGAIAGGTVWGYTVERSGSFAPDDMAKLLIAAASICFGAICFMQEISNQEKKIASEEKEIIKVRKEEMKKRR
ncbi:MAG: hypothetical protein KKC75_01505 [Nanoarchaeota archaeon]|nr:hypothetical protein [Nanoarchaeota archaeon]MBU1004371.1 hypothetical protein [Nanoarchaeota archaeon]MBU1946742.1 hypothetical protein [Nanoarchaeota archaeon]